MHRLYGSSYQVQNEARLCGHAKVDNTYRGEPGVGLRLPLHRSARHRRFDRRVGFGGEWGSEVPGCMRANLREAPSAGSAT